MMTKNIKKINIFFVLIVLFSFFTPLLSHAQSSPTSQEVYNAKVLEISNEFEEEEIPGLGTFYTVQEIQAEVLSGPLKGEVLTLQNDYIKLRKGNKFYFTESLFSDSNDSYDIVSVNRSGSLILLTLLFVALVIWFGKKQGIRSILALVGSFFVIFAVLLPGLLNGWNPLIASFLVAGGILFFAIFFTHGFNRESSVAYCGTMIAVLISGFLAVFAVYITSLSGFASEEAVYLNLNTGGDLNFTALLLGAFIIGFLGVLDDIAVTQAAVVSELYQSNPEISRKEVYKRAMRVGREHVGALVNTLILAYTGASLPLLLYFKLGSSNFSTLINTEIFTTEIVRILVGSVGLILTVPIVTFLAVRYLKGYKSKNPHSHGHGH